MKPDACVVQYMLTCPCSCSSCAIFKILQRVADWFLVLCLQHICSLLFYHVDCDVICWMECSIIHTTNFLKAIPHLVSYMLLLSNVFKYCFGEFLSNVCKYCFGEYIFKCLEINLSEVSGKIPASTGKNQHLEKPRKFWKCQDFQQGEIGYICNTFSEVRAQMFNV